MFPFYNIFLIMMSTFFCILQYFANNDEYCLLMKINKPNLTFFGLAVRISSVWIIFSFKIRIKGPLKEILLLIVLSYSFLTIKSVDSSKLYLFNY